MRQCTVPRPQVCARCTHGAGHERGPGPAREPEAGVQAVAQALCVLDGERDEGGGHVAPHHRFTVSSIHELYVEKAGNPKGKPAILVHGGRSGRQNQVPPPLSSRRGAQVPLTETPPNHTAQARPSGQRYRVRGCCVVHSRT